MDKTSLIKELNESTKELDEFQRALKESGFDLPPEDDMDGEMVATGDEEADVVADAEDELDTGDEEGYTAESPLDEEELQDIVSWCEEECGEMSDEELADTLRDELAELELEPEELDATIDQVMSMLGRGEEEVSDDEMGGEDEIDFEAGAGGEEEIPGEEEPPQF